MTIVSILVTVAGALVLVGFILHRLALWAEARGWIFYRTKPRFRGSTLGYLEEIYNPALHHVIEERDSERTVADRDESGGTPDPGGEAATPNSERESSTS